MILKDELRELAERVEKLSGPDLGMRFTSGHYGERRFDELTGLAYTTTARPAELTVYGERAKLLFEIISDHTGTIAAALRARASIKGSSDAD